MLNFLLIIMWIFKFDKFCITMLLKDMHTILFLLLILTLLFNYMAVKVIFVFPIETFSLFWSQIATNLYQFPLRKFKLRGVLFGIHCLEWNLIIERILVWRRFTVWKSIVFSWFPSFLLSFLSLILNIICYFFTFL